MLISQKMEEGHPQQTRVIVVNGQALLVHSDSTDNCIDDINSQLLERAFQEANTSVDVNCHDNEFSNEIHTSNGGSDNVLAVISGAQGETHTVQLTVEQAEALGLHYSDNDDIQDTCTNEGKAIKVELERDVSEANLLLTEGNTSLVYSQAGSLESDGSIFSSQLSEQLSDVQNGNIEHVDESGENLGTLHTPVSSYLGPDGNAHPITLISQVVDGQLTYTVKVGNEQTSLPQTGYPQFDHCVKPENQILNQNNSINTLVTSSIQSPVTSLVSQQQSSIQPVSFETPKMTVAHLINKPKLSYVISPTLSNQELMPKFDKSIVSKRLGDGLRTIHRNHVASNSILTNNRYINAASTTSNLGSEKKSVLATTSLGPAISSNQNKPGTKLILNMAPSSTTANGSATHVYTKVPHSVSGITKINISNKSGAIYNALTKKSVSTNIQNKINPVPNVVSAALTKMPAGNFNSTKPLGSSENPIQLVQHGQTFHSVQKLSQEQLKQIATVLQTQSLESAPRTKNVLYDAETNTRIIYRVVYPEDLDLKESHSQNNNGHIQGSSLLMGRGRGRRGRPPKTNFRGSIGRGLTCKKPMLIQNSSMELDLEEDRLLDDSAKVERKKQLARTRSGRLSRPPRHMIKDYKRLHHLDFADADLDDSDGGYSDYQISDHETEDHIGPPKEPAKELEPVVPIVPKRNISAHFRCPTCQKIYLGHRRMAHHFEKYPDHGSKDQLEAAMTNSETVVQKNSPSVNGVLKTGGATRGKGKRKGPWAYMTPEARSQRRKIKLKEALQPCEASELSEIAGPAVASILSLWDLLLLRVEAVRSEEGYVATLLDELQALIEKVREVVSEILHPLLEPQFQGTNDQLELRDDLLCSMLGLTSGYYHIDDTKLWSNRETNLSTEEEPPNKKTKCSHNGEIELANTPEESISPSNICEIKPDMVLETPNSLLKDDAKLSSGVKESRVPDIKIIKPDIDVHEDFLLPSEGELDSSTGENICNQSCLSDTEQQSRAIQAVDDIVNERLNNLTAESSLVDFSVSVPMDLNSVSSKHNLDEVSSSQQELMESLGNIRTSLDPSSAHFSAEIALAAISEGENSVVPSQNHLTQYNSPLENIDSLNGNHQTFDPQMALGRMGKDSQAEGNGSPHRHFQSLSNQVTSGFVSEISLSPVDEDRSAENKTNHSQFTSTLNNLTDVNPTFSSHMEDDCEIPRTNQYQSLQQNASVSNFPPELSIEVMDSCNSTDNLNTQQLASILHHTTMQSPPAFSNIGTETSNHLNKHQPEDVGPVTSFDPEMALVAMGEGDEATRAEVIHMQFKTNATFDPEIALAAMGEGETSVGVAAEYNEETSRTTVNSRTFQIPSLTDVGLDESGSDLDFEALSEEFGHASQHR